MMAALLSAALWVNLATWIGAPVSTTHSVVGGVMGAGIAAAGFAAVNWPTMGAIAASWVISPVLGGAIAAAFLAFIKARIIYREDKIAAARVGCRCWSASWPAPLRHIWRSRGCQADHQIDCDRAAHRAGASARVDMVVDAPDDPQAVQGLENRNKSLKVLFGMPLVVSAALLSVCAWRQ